MLGWPKIWGVTDPIRHNRREKPRRARNGRAGCFYGVSLALFLLVSGCVTSPPPKAPQPAPEAEKPTPTNAPAASLPVQLDLRVATIAGEPLNVREYRWHLDRGRSMVVRDLIAKYDIPDPANFWTTPIDGETPWERLREQALDFAIRFKLEQMAARERGLPAVMSYAELKRLLTLENQRRAERARQNKPLPGPSRFSEGEYYFYTQSQTHIELLRVMGETELAVTEEEVLDYYESHKNRVVVRRSQSSPRGEAVDVTKEEIRNQLIESKYNAWLDELCEKTVVVVDDLVLDAQKTILTAPSSFTHRREPERAPVRPFNK
jgi:hypothetical protein